MTLPDLFTNGETSMVEFNISYDDVKRLAFGTLPDWNKA